MMANLALSISVLEIILQATDAISHTRLQPCVDIQATGQGPVHARQAQATYAGRPAKPNVIRKAKGGDTLEAKQKEKPHKCPSPSLHLCAGRQRRRGSAVKKPRRRSTAEGCAGSERHVVHRPLIEPGNSPPLKVSAGARTRPPSSPHLCAGRQRSRGSAVKPRRRSTAGVVPARSAKSCSARSSNPATDSPPLEGPSEIHQGENPAPLRPHMPVGCVLGGSEEGARMSSSPGDCVVILY